MFPIFSPTRFFLAGDFLYPYLCTVERKKTPVLNLLPPVFTLSEAYSCFKQKPQSSVRGLLKRLADQGLITLEGRGTYSKTNKS